MLTNGEGPDGYVMPETKKSVVTALQACAKRDALSENLTNKYFTEFMVCLIDIFKKDRKMLDRRGAFIIR